MKVLILVFLGVLICAPMAGAYDSGKATLGNPLAGYPWYVDQVRGAWWVALRTNPAAAPLRPFADNPMSKSFGSSVAEPSVEVRNYILRAESEQPGSIPFLNVGRLEAQSCPYPPTPPGFSESEIESWLRAFSQGIGDYRVLVIVETDKLAVINCLPAWAKARRYHELSYEVQLLHENNPNAIVYLDAGSEDWGKSAATMADRLKRANVAEAAGFVLGASHHDLTSKEDAFGLKISRYLGGKHFVVNTDSNGWGDKPHAPTPWSAFYHGGCTPPGEGLGIRPTVKTPSHLIDAYLWLGTPGYEIGQCLGLGAGSPYAFYLQQALSLVHFANPPLR